MIKPVFFALTLCLVLIGCDNQSTNEISKNNAYSDTVLVTIKNLQDKRDSEGLLPFLKHENPTYRKYAVEAFASIQDSAYRSSIFNVLINDEDVTVRKTAAYSMGQLYDSASVSFLFDALAMEDSIIVRKNILEAIGKNITQTDVYMYSQLQINSELEKQGLAWGYYRAVIRNVHDKLLLDNIVELLKNDNHEIRLAAAHALGRIRDTDLSEYVISIGEIIKKEKSAFVKMPLATALGKAENSGESFDLLSNLVSDYDYRVRVNAIKAISKFEESKSEEILINSLQDSNVNVSIAAAEVLSINNLSLDQVELLIKDTLNWRVKSLLYRKANMLFPEKFTPVLKKLYSEETDPVIKSNLLSAIGQNIAEYEFIVTETFNSDNKVISTAGINVLTQLRRKDNFPKELIVEFSEIFKSAMLSGDLAMIGITSYVLINDKFNFKEVYEDYSFLDEASKKLNLPKDNEALQALERTKAYFEEREYEPVENGYNNPINWENITDIQDDHKAEIHTDKGTIVIRLIVNEAPGSVENFVDLVNKQYFNGIEFHRVVPNFVVQGGCNRGDGWGGEDFSIRSELSDLHYREGTIGMASAGKDTEGTQWFITHSPTPHLDGAYSIFAQVIEGMDVVKNLEIGDEIIDIAIK